MKTLILIRHAKSSWSNPGLDDFDRPINDRGRRDAPSMGKLLSTKPDQPALILSSPAKRAITTARIIADELGYKREEIVEKKKLYHAPANSILNTVGEQNDDVDCLAVVGHNPGMTELANIITNVNLDNLPTTGIFAVQFDVTSWKDVPQIKGDFLYFEFPKKHRKVKIS